MPESVVWQCSGCGYSIGTDEEVIETIERRAPDVDTGSIDPIMHVITMPHYAHVGHEGTDLLRGYHKSGQGKLADLREREKRPPAPPKA